MEKGTKKKAPQKKDPIKDRNTAMCNLAVAAIAIALAAMQGGSLLSARFVLYMVVAALNIVAAVFYYMRYKK